MATYHLTWNYLQNGDLFAVLPLGYSSTLRHIHRVDLSDEIEEILGGTQTKSTPFAPIVPLLHLRFFTATEQFHQVVALEKLHAKHVLPGFTDRSAEEREIEAATTDITKVNLNPVFSIGFFFSSSNSPWPVIGLPAMSSPDSTDRLFGTGTFFSSIVSCATRGPCCKERSKGIGGQGTGSERNIS
jgi:hypothetical protein